MQRFFLGHTAHVVAIAFDAEGAVMATAQEGKQAVIRLWDFKRGTCVAILNGELSKPEEAVHVPETTSCLLAGLCLASGRPQCCTFMAPS